MIRNLVMMKLVDGYDAAEVADIQEGLRHLDPPGCLAYVLENDLGLRDGNWTFGIVADFVDEAAYRAYDEETVHNELRARLKPFIESVARVQLSVD